MPEKPSPSREPIAAPVRAPLGRYLHALSPVLGSVAPALVAGGMPDDADALFGVEPDEFDAFLDELDPPISKVARVLFANRLAAERSQRSASSGP